jgi:1-pyrroline-5-carboxylate dehydrogenase
VKVPDTTVSEAAAYLESMQRVPRSGLHNPLKNIDRYLLYGRVCTKVTMMLHQPEVFDFFTHLIQRVAPKSKPQAAGELAVVRIFFENFCGDNVRFLARGHSSPGDHLGQQPHSYRWPFGPVAIICPFNFPIEIPIMQLMGALFMGNKAVLKPDARVALAAEQFIRLLHHCGMPAEDCDLLNGGGEAIEHLVRAQAFKTIQFTGSNKIAEKLAEISHGRVRLEDAGFDWKILGPDVSDFEYVAWQSDQDAYAFSGQKCSAQSILFAHKNWADAGFIEKLGELAARRRLEDLTIAPIITWSNERIEAHISALLTIPGAKVAFGGNRLTGHSIPAVYGSFEPTAVFVPFTQIEGHFEAVTTELFGPVQVVTVYEDIEEVLGLIDRMPNLLTAGVVSRDAQFLNYVLGATTNGVTYAGPRARTTGAPQNHWFGPAGDPRAAGIGTAEAIHHVWSSHREIIMDHGPVPSTWTLPPPS